MNKSYKLKNCGTALPLVLVAVVILLIMGTSLLSMGLTNRFFSLRNTSDIVARCAADAGVTQALFEMNQKLHAKTLISSELPSESKLNLNNCDAEYSYVVKGSLAGGYTITSIGESGNAQRLITASLGLQGLFDHAILTKDSLILKSGTTIDGYNSKDTSATDIAVKIGTQSTEEDKIVLNNSVVVDGDVAVGMNGSIDTVIKDLGATVNGDKHVATTIEPLPDVTVPALPDKGTSLTVKSGTIQINESDSGTYTRIDLQNGKDIGRLEVTDGDVELHITGNIDLDQNCEIVVKDGATLKIYIDGNINCRNGSGINTEAPPEEASTLQLFATGQGQQYLDVKAKSDWTGMIYAPNADVILYAGGDAYGAIVADSFEFKAGGDFHYDEALKDVTIFDPGVRFVVTRWSESKINLETINLESLEAVKVGVLSENTNSSLK